MRFALTDDQIEFRGAVRGLLEQICTPDDVRAAWAGGEGGDGRVRGAWAALADMGVLGLTVDEVHGGMGLADDDLAPMVLECGWAGLPDPVADTAGTAVGLLRAAADAGHEASGQLLSAIAAGGATVVVGFGDAPTVASAATADSVIVVQDGRVHLLDAAAAGLEALESVDGSRGLCRVGVDLGPASVVLDGEPGGVAAATAFDRAATLDAALLVGLSRRMLDITVAYAAERRQFGVPIGSFQAVKHHLADAALAVEFAEPLVLSAAHALGTGADATVAASMAKARASRAAIGAARASLQCHGAIGYTVECDLHLFMKRAWALARGRGDAGFHVRRVRSHLFGR
jgi:alkylation response protein AidB-like acyl-CoA dehydrogenase